MLKLAENAEGDNGSAAGRLRMDLVVAGFFISVGEAKRAKDLADICNENTRLQMFRIHHTRLDCFPSLNVLNVLQLPWEDK
jgi:hypothetical protein